MFGLGDKDTPEVARLLFLRAREVARVYLPLTFEELKPRLKEDFSDEQHWAHDQSAGFVYPDLPNFSFEINMFIEDNTLSVFGGDRFAGFMLQRGPSGDNLRIDVKAPLSRPLGSKAARLGDIFQKQYGATNPRATVARFMQR